MSKVESYIRKHNPGMEARVLRHPQKLREVIESADITGPYRILEIGTFKGATTMRLAEWFPEAIVESINVNPRELEEAMKHVKAVGVADRIHFHLGDSLTVLKSMADQGCTFDVIIVDGLHTADHVQAETEWIEYFVVKSPENTLVIYDDTDRVDYKLDFEYDGSYKNFSWKLMG